MSVLPETSGSYPQNRARCSFMDYSFPLIIFGEYLNLLVYIYLEFDILLNSIKNFMNCLIVSGVLDFFFEKYVYLCIYHVAFNRLNILQIIFLHKNQLNSGCAYGLFSSMLARLPKGCGFDSH